MEYLIKLRAMLYDPKRRSYVILPALIVILSLVLWRQMTTWPQEDPPGALHWLRCSSCPFSAEMRVVDLSDGSYRCPKCKAKLGYPRKCNKCSYEFVDVPKPIVFPKDATKSQVYDLMEEARKCPNCGGTDTYIINEPPH